MVAAHEDKGFWQQSLSSRKNKHIEFFATLLRLVCSCRVARVRVADFAARWRPNNFEQIVSPVQAKKIAHVAVATF